MNIYLNFEIWIDPALQKPKKGELAEYPVRVTISPMGPCLGTLRLNLKDPDFKRDLVAVRDAGVNLEKRKAFGRLLYDALFSGDTGKAWVGSMAKLDSTDVQGMRLRLWINEPELAKLPWELMYCESYGGFLSTVANLAVSRYLPVLEPPLQPILGPLQVLIAVASPKGLKEIPENDIQCLETALTNLSPNVHYQVERDISAGKIQAALNHQIHILHFLGHGQPGGLSLVREADKGIDPITDEGFAQLFAGRPHLRLVVLSACASGERPGTDLFSGVGPAIIQKRVPAVIAMQYDTVQMDTAAQFSTALYQGLLDGFPVDIAVNSARQTLSAGDLLKTRDWSTPVLYMGTRSGDILSQSTETLSLWGKAKTHIQEPELVRQLEHSFETISNLQKELEEFIEVEGDLSTITRGFSECVQIVSKANGQYITINTSRVRTALQAVRIPELVQLDDFLTRHLAVRSAVNPSISSTTLQEEVEKVDTFAIELSPVKAAEQVLFMSGILSQLQGLFHEEQLKIVQRLNHLLVDVL